MSSNKSPMNELIVDHVRRGQRQLGLVDRLKGASLDQRRQERLNTALADYEHAAKRNDLAGMEMADARIDALIVESRERRQAAASADGSEPAPQMSFDGGVRKPMPRRKSMNELIRQAAGHW